MCITTEFNNLVKTHVYFHQGPSEAILHSTRIPKLSPNLTLAIAAAIALLTAFLVDHRVAATLGAEVACQRQSAEIKRVVIVRFWLVIVTVAIVTIAVAVVVLASLFGLERLDVHFQRTGNRVWQRAY